MGSTPFFGSIRSASHQVDDFDTRNEATGTYTANPGSISTRLLTVFLRTADLGFTSFGGPYVHFQIFHRRFVDGLGKRPWIDEQTVRCPNKDNSLSSG